MAIRYRSKRWPELEVASDMAVKIYVMSGMTGTLQLHRRDSCLFAVGLAARSVRDMCRLILLKKVTRTPQGNILSTMKR